MDRETTRYREYSGWPSWAYVVVWGAVTLSCYPILAGWDADVSPSLRWILVLGILGVVGVIVTLLGGLTVSVEETHIFVHLGRFPVIRKTIPYSEVLDCVSVEYRPIAEFGGWGVRGRGKRRAWTSRGNKAVRLDLRGGRELLIGSDSPQRLEERIRTIGRGQFARQEPADRD